MNDRLDKLTDDIDVDTAISVSDLQAVVNPDSESSHADQPHEEKSVQHYTETKVTDDAVATLNEWIDNDQTHAVSDEIVTEHVDEILLVLIAVRDGACGKELLQDIRQLFGTDLSPGTVYPHLIDLADDGVLEMQKLSKRKLYHLSDPDAMSAQVDHAVDQFLLFSLFLKGALTECETNQSQSQYSRSETNE